MKSGRTQLDYFQIMQGNVNLKCFIFYIVLRLIWSITLKMSIFRYFFTVEEEIASNKFCSMPDICNRAFRNSFFTKKNHWILKDEDSTKTRCVEKTIVVQKGGKSFADMRKYVKCKTKSEKDGEKGPDVFLEVSTRYVPGKNLKYFALLDQNGDGFVKPVAYLMNTKDLDSVEIPIEEAEKPLLEGKASKMDTHS